MANTICRQKLHNSREVKRWLRKFPVATRELDMRISFYNEMLNDISRSAIRLLKADEYIKHYEDQVRRLLMEREALLSDWERLSSLLGGGERTLINLKYRRGTSWLNMKNYVYYTSNQCRWLLSRAVYQLVGQAVFCR